MKKVSGIYNVGSNNGLNKAEFAIMFAKILGLSTKSLLKKYDEINNSKIKRPKNMIMDISKFENRFNIKLPTLDDEILKLKKNMKEYLS